MGGHTACHIAYFFPEASDRGSLRLGVRKLIGKGAWGGSVDGGLIGCVPGSKLPLFPYNRGWSSTQ